MPFKDTTEEANYSEFFMKKAGKRQLRLGATSVIDELILGRDTDMSGADPHKEFMRRYGDHAGAPSGQESARRKKPGYGMASIADDVIWGRDVDRSGGGTDAEERFKAHFGEGHAGVAQSLERPARPSKKGAYSMTSVMDSVIWGRDLDRSGGDPHEYFAKTYTGHAGGASGERPARPLKKPLLGMCGVMDEVLTGRDLDGSADVQEARSAKLEGHAGIRSGQKPERPFRKPVHMAASADRLIYSKEIGPAYGEHWDRKFGGYAGARGSPRSHREAKRRAASSTAALHGQRGHSREQDRWKEYEQQVRYGNKSDFQPLTRGGAGGRARSSGAAIDHGGRGQQRPQSARQEEQMRRNLSPRPLTSREYGGFMSERRLRAEPGLASPGCPLFVPAGASCGSSTVGSTATGASGSSPQRRPVGYGGYY